MQCVVQLSCIQLPILPRGLNRDVAEFHPRMTPLEMLCFSFDSVWDEDIGAGRFYNGSAPASAIVDTVSDRICSWVSMHTVCKQ